MHGNKSRFPELDEVPFSVADFNIAGKADGSDQWGLPQEVRMTLVALKEVQKQVLSLQEGVGPSKFLHWCVNFFSCQERLLPSPLRNPY